VKKGGAGVDRRGAREKESWSILVNVRRHDWHCSVQLRQARLALLRTGRHDSIQAGTTDTTGRHD